MREMVPFRYGGFCDVPRGILLKYKGTLFYLRSAFDEDLDEYPDTYSVFVVPPQLEPIEANPSWDFIRNLESLKHVGNVAVKQVDFDETKRKELDASILEQFIGKRGTDGT